MIRSHGFFIFELPFFRMRPAAILLYRGAAGFAYSPESSPRRRGMAEGAGGRHCLAGRDLPCAGGHPSAVYCSLRTWRKSPFKNVVITSTYRKLRPKNRGGFSFRVVSV